MFVDVHVCFVLLFFIKVNIFYFYVCFCFFVIGPPSCQSSGWINRFSDPSIAMASGWMVIRGTRRRRGVDRGFVLSDHVAWPDLLNAIEACGPEQVWVTHGFTEVVSRFLSERGLEAQVLKTRFAGEESEPSDPESSAEHSGDSQGDELKDAQQYDSEDHLQ